MRMHEFVTSRSPFGDPSLGQTGRHMATRSDDELDAIW